MFRKFLSVIIAIALVASLTAATVSADAVIGPITFNDWSASSAGADYQGWIADTAKTNVDYSSAKKFGDVNAAFVMTYADGLSINATASAGYISRTYTGSVALTQGTEGYRLTEFDIAVENTASSIEFFQRAVVNASGSSATSRVGIVSIDGGKMTMWGGATLVSSVLPKCWYNVNVVEHYTAAGSYTMTVYVDGVQKGSRSGTTTIGSVSDSDARFYAPSDIGVHNKSAMNITDGGAGYINNLKISTMTAAPAITAKPAMTFSSESVFLNADGAIEIPYGMTVAELKELIVFDGYTLSVLDENSVPSDENAAAKNNYLVAAGASNTYIYLIQESEPYSYQFGPINFEGITNFGAYSIGTWRNIKGGSSEPSDFADAYALKSNKFGSATTAFFVGNEEGSAAQYSGRYSKTNNLSAELTADRKYRSFGFDIAFESADINGYITLHYGGTNINVMSFGKNGIGTIGSTQISDKIQPKHWYKMTFYEVYDAVTDTALWDVYVDGHKIVDGYEDVAAAAATEIRFTYSENSSPETNDDGTYKANGMYIDNVSMLLTEAEQTFAGYAEGELVSCAGTTVVNEYPRAIYAEGTVNCSDFTAVNSNVTIVDENGAAVSGDSALLGNYVKAAVGEETVVYKVCEYPTVLFTTADDGIVTAITSSSRIDMNGAAVPQIIIAEYSDTDDLVQYALGTNTGSSYTASLARVPADSSVIRAFVWDMGNLMPLCESVTK